MMNVKEKQYQLWCLKLLMTLIFFNAFLVSSRLPDGIVLPKNMALWLTAGLSLIMLSFRLFIGSVTLKLNLTDILAILVLILIPAAHMTFLDTLYPLILSQIAIGIVYLAIRVLSSGIKPIFIVNAFAEILVISLGLHLIIALAQYFHYIPSYHSAFKVTGMFFNPGPFAIYLSALSGFTSVVCWLLYKNNKYVQASALLIMLVISMTFVIQSLTRSAWVGIVISTITMLIVLNKKFVEYWGAKKIVTNAFAVAIGFILLLFVYSIFQFKQASVEGRELIWKVTVNLIMDQPLAGVGCGNFPVKYLPYQASFLSSSSQHSFSSLAGDNRYAFNDTLQLTAEYGLPTCFLFLTILFQAFKQMYRRLCTSFNSDWQTLSVVGIYSIMSILLLAGLSSYPLQVTPISLLFWSSLAILFSIFPAPYTCISISTSNCSIVLGGLFLVSGSYLIRHSFDMLGGYLIWRKVEKTQGLSLQERKSAMETLFSTLKHDPEYLKQTGILYLLLSDNKRALFCFKKAAAYTPDKEVHYYLGTCYERMNQVSKAEYTYMLIQTGIPSLMRPRYLLTRLYYNQHLNRKFIKQARQTLAFKPKINSTEVMIMKDEILQMIKNNETRE